MKPSDHAGGGARATRARGATERRIGLARALSKLGYCSRSRAALLIRDGKVRLNGRVRRDAETPVRLGVDKIHVEEQPVAAKDFVYLAMNKPRGIVTTASDEKGRATVYSLLYDASLYKDLPWVAPVGRLDKASEGLLLLTNDSEWGGRISSPDSQLEKTYHVQVRCPSSLALVEALSSGGESRGELLRAKSVALLREGARNVWLEITLLEGKNRHIRRMIESCDAEVLRLIRVSIGPLQLGNLAKGMVRELSSREKDALDGAVTLRG